MRRATGVLHERLGGSERGVDLLPEDIADSGNLGLSGPGSHLPRGSALTVGWVSSPPGLGSGGHTTMFRMISALERAGHRCVVFLYDTHRGSIGRHEATIRRGWPQIHCPVVDAAAGIAGVDVCVATSWETAHVVVKRGASHMRRAYFIQDYEPFFYPHGWEYALAEESYRFGFRSIALGSMVAELLRTEIGIDSDLIEFGSDTSNYNFKNLGPRNGVVFFARPGVARRGYQLGKMALEEFHKYRPDQRIHFYGSDTRDVPFPVERHGVLSPSDLNDLYNRVVAGVALSFTNVSLVPEEMLAAGVVPVCNESALARACLTDPNVSWVSPTPSAIANRLGELVQAEDIGGQAALVAASVRRGGWEATQDAVVRIVEDEAYGRSYRR